MKPIGIRLKASIVAVSLAWLTGTAGTADGASWQSVADFKGAGFPCLDALAASPGGSLYAAICISDSQARTHAQVWKSDYEGCHWSMVEDSVAGALSSIRFLALGADPAGNLYAVGYTMDENGRSRWIVKKSGGDCGAWTTVDDFTLQDGQDAIAQDFAVDPSGNLLVAGYGADLVAGQPAQQMHWLVRQSRDGGRTWAMSDDFRYDYGARAKAILSTPAGLFVAGSGWNGSSGSCERWLVRRGTPDGARGVRWQTVDQYQLQEGNTNNFSQPEALGRDTRGNVYAAGRGSLKGPCGNSVHWVVRRASPAGDRWRTVDVFQLEPGSMAVGRRIAAGTYGVYVAGQAVEDTTGCHWVVRHSTTGEAGEWSTSDKFQISTMTTESLVQMLTTTRTSPGRSSQGRAVLCLGNRVFAGGSTTLGAPQAVVRRLDHDARFAADVSRQPEPGRSIAR